MTGHHRMYIERKKERINEVMHEPLDSSDGDVDIAIDDS